MYYNYAQSHVLQPYAAQAQKVMNGFSRSRGEKTDTLSGECLDAPDVGRYEFIWQSRPTSVTKNKNGITGWAELLKSSNANNPAGTICRIHLCGHNPCLAVWPDTKYGLMGPPMHLQPVAEPPAAETPATAVAETTVTGSTTGSTSGGGLSMDEG